MQISVFFFLQTNKSTLCRWYMKQLEYVNRNVCVSVSVCEKEREECAHFAVLYHLHLFPNYLNISSLFCPKYHKINSAIFLSLSFFSYAQNIAVICY